MKYVKPLSLTWWAAMVPLALGLFMATLPLHEQAAVVAVIEAMTGGAPAYALINAGLLGVGLRGAL